MAVTGFALLMTALVLSAPAALPPVGPPAAAPEPRISNGVLSIASCKRDAGALCSIVYDGEELVNDHDHGRQLQVAWSYNGMGEAYNPTEAGSHDDGTGNSSTSELVSLRIDGRTLSTESHPAFWHRPGKGANLKPVTRDTLKKSVTLGYGEESHVIVVESEVTVSPELTGPAVKTIRVESPAFYASSIFTGHYQLDRRTGAVENLRVPLRPDVKNRMNSRMVLNLDHNVVPVMSSDDGRYAVALYTPQGENFWSYSTFNIPSDLPANACSKVTARFEHPVEAGQSYRYRTFVVVGNLPTVLEVVKKLPGGEQQAAGTAKGAK